MAINNKPLILSSNHYHQVKQFVNFHKAVYGRYSFPYYLQLCLSAVPSIYRVHLSGAFVMGITGYQHVAKPVFACRWATHMCQTKFYMQ